MEVLVGLALAKSGMAFPLDLRCQAEAEALRRSLENPLTLVQGE